MPSTQRGQVHKSVAGTWGVRFYDEVNTRKRAGGFATRREALDFLERKVDEVAALRRGDPATLRRRQIPTLSALVDEFTAQHVAEENTLRTLKDRLRYATDAFGDVRIDRLQASEIGAWQKRLPEKSAWHVHKALRQSSALRRTGEAGR
jgi:hypothetical protein